MLAVEKVLQSQKEWLFRGDTTVMFVHAAIPHGGRGLPLSRAATKLSEYLKIKRTIITMLPDSKNMCFARALVVAIAEADKVSYRHRIRRNMKLQKRLAAVMHRRAGFPVGLMCGPEEWELFQEALGTRYSIVVVSRDHFNTVVYWGNKSEKSKVLGLYHAERHFHVILSLAAFMGESYVCPHCSRGSRSRAKHMCALTCYHCRTGGQCGPGREGDTMCRECNMSYPNAECYERHIASGICEDRKRCKECGRIAMKGRQHICHNRLCKKCKRYLPNEHKCYMQPLPKEKEGGKAQKYYFYDFESISDRDARGKHTPNLCVVHRVCGKCMDRPMHLACEELCGRERKIFKGRDTLREFGEYIMNGKNAGAVALAHNAGQYDTHFILAYAHSVGIKPAVVVRGRTIMSLRANGVKFNDSLNFLPMALSKLPAAFDLGELKKGYFPHTFNTEENEAYIGSMPDISHYNPDEMKDAQRTGFLKWYEEQRGKTFNMADELEAYCISDVDILQRSCGAFRNLYIKHTGIDPLSKSLTLSSACMRVFRTNWLQAGVIALLPPTGYFYGQQSGIAVCWLTHLSAVTGKNIRHYGNQGEVKVRGRYVDGVDAEGQLYFFHGKEHFFFINLKIKDSRGVFESYQIITMTCVLCRLCVSCLREMLSRQRQTKSYKRSEHERSGL